MHASRAGSLSLDGRYHSPLGEASGYEPHAQALGTTADWFIDGLWSRPSRFNDLALLACINYMRRSGSQTSKLSGGADWRWLTLHLSHIFDKIISEIYCEVMPSCSIRTIFTILDKLWYWNINSDFLKIRHAVNTKRETFGNNMH